MCCTLYSTAYYAILRSHSINILTSASCCSILLCTIRRGERQRFSPPLPIACVLSSLTTRRISSPPHPLPSLSHYSHVQQTSHSRSKSFFSREIFSSGTSQSKIGHIPAAWMTSFHNVALLLQAATTG